MNRRIRSPNGKPSPASSRIEERLQRFLKPGALARLRDSRISSARSPRSTALHRLRLSPPSSPSPAAPPSAAAAAHQIDGLPCFVSRSYGPRIPQRKKLAAAKSIFFAPSSPELLEHFLDAFGLDLVAAH